MFEFADRFERLDQITADQGDTMTVSNQVTSPQMNIELMKTSQEFVGLVIVGLNTWKLEIYVSTGSEIIKSGELPVANAYKDPVGMGRIADSFTHT